MLTIRRMTATFGCLENETLTLTPGLNVFTAPNEAGKSTWAAFLTAMFYGIDTAERVKKGAVPAKTKYKPWSGKPMEGAVELTCRGRNITLLRQSDSRAPMSIFTARDTDTGEEIPFLTAENCGKTLLGVEKSVFLRSAFVGQNALSVTQDAALEQKLLSLVTTGDESVSAAQTEKRLREQKNHIRHNRTGLLPEAERRLAAVEEQLRSICRCQEEDASLLARRRELTEQKAHLQYIQKNLRAAEALEKQRQLSAAEEAFRKTEQAHAQAADAAEKLPARQELSALSEKLTAPAKVFPLWSFAAVTAAAAVAAFFLLRPLSYALLAVSACLLGVWLLLRLGRRKAQNALLAAVRSFADNIYTPDDAIKAVCAGLAARTQAETAAAALRHTRDTFTALQTAIGPVEEVEPPAEDFTDRYSLPQVAQALSRTEQELHAIETTLAQHRGSMEALGDPAALAAEQEALTQRIAALERHNAALTAALETLGEAAEQLRSRFSPQISHTAAEFLRRMTDSRYDGFYMEQDMTLHARPFGEDATRQLLALSGGTADQLYLALRLAVCKLALEEGTPLILDDALVFFDDTRLARTMDLLKEEAETRQILLFSCQSREAEYLNTNT